MSNYKPNRRGLEQMATSPKMQEVVLRVAEKAKTIAEGISQEFRDTGEYADSFEIIPTEVTVNIRFPHKAAGAQLRNTAGYAAAVEWGKGGTAAQPGRKAHHVLARTLAELGK